MIAGGNNEVARITILVAGGISFMILFYFVFGEAYVNGRVSVIYLPRLRQEFYGLKADNFLFHQRIIKEAVYELGHAFGIRHCENKRCVMHFSNSLADTDIKAKNFCKRCNTLL